MKALVYNKNMLAHWKSSMCDESYENLINFITQTQNNIPKSNVVLMVNNLDNLDVGLVRRGIIINLF